MKSKVRVMKNTGNNGECHVLYVSVKNKFHT